MKWNSPKYSAKVNLSSPNVSPLGSGQETTRSGGGEAAEKHANPMGTLHGGIVCDVIRCSDGNGIRKHSRRGETFTTVQLKINLFRPAWNAKLGAEAKVIQRGKTLGFVECDIRDDQD